MAIREAATKGNLLRLTKSLSLAESGYELLDRKKNILMRETMRLIDKSKELQSSIDEIYSQAYSALAKANSTLGIVDEMSRSVQTDNGISLSGRSIMGVEIPIVKYEHKPPSNNFGYHRTNVRLDEAYIKFNQAKEKTLELAELLSSVFRLAEGIKTTRKRANALKNIIIPRLQTQIADITDALSEKEREEFARLKVIKKKTEETSFDT